MRKLGQHSVECRLDHGVKGISWIKLVGYFVFNKRQVGYANQHEEIADDWVAVHIDKVDGKVVSNNRYADRAFAVLHVGASSDSVTGAIEYHMLCESRIPDSDFERIAERICNGSHSSPHGAIRQLLTARLLRQSR